MLNLSDVRLVKTCGNMHSLERRKRESYELADHWELLDRRTNLLYSEIDYDGGVVVLCFGSKAIMEKYKNKNHITVRVGAGRYNKLLSRYWGLHSEFRESIKTKDWIWFNDFTGWSARHGKFWWQHPKYPSLVDLRND